MFILVTNDDGVHAEGIRQLVNVLRRRHEVVVVAPDRERSGVGHGITVWEPLWVQELTLEGGVQAFAVSGTPADCVKIAIDALLDRRPDLVISGVNDGANLGTDVLYSGTVSAAIEGAIMGCRSVAVSLNGTDSSGYAFAAEVAEMIGRRLVESDFSSELLLNVNVPCIPREEVRGIRVTRLGVRRYQEVFHRREDPRGRAYYWLAGYPVDVDGDDESTDAAALKAGWISLTPLHYDLTTFGALDDLAAWDLTL